ncbi:MAG: phage holin family protein [Verrucomicrobia subdivision 3 bacterium]|nr:phage holin family protein [Limisphaerales bacterium]
MAEGNHSGGGIFSSVRRVADTALSSIHTRIELFSIELQEEKQRLVRLLLWTVITLFAAFLAITVLTVMVCMFFPTEQWKYVLMGFGLVYVAIAVATSFKLRDEVRNTPPPLADTMAELRKDLECLRSRE